MQPKTAAADRVIAVLAKDPSLLAAVKKRLGVPQHPLEEALVLLKEGQIAFQRFRELNGILQAVSGAGGSSGHKQHPKLTVWKAFMADDAIPRNIKVAKMLATYFKGHLPPEVQEFCQYVDEYQDLITDWDNNVPDAAPTTGRNFPAGFDAYIRGLRDNQNPANTMEMPR